MPAVGGHHVDGVVLGRRDDAAVGDERLAIQLPVEDRRGPGSPRRQQLGVRRVDSGRLSVPVVGGPVGAEAGGPRHEPRPRCPGGRDAGAAERRSHQGRSHSEGYPQVPPGSRPRHCGYPSASFSPPNASTRHDSTERTRGGAILGRQRRRELGRMSRSQQPVRSRVRTLKS